MQENKNRTELIEKAFRRIVEPMISHPENLEVKIVVESETMVIIPTAHFSDSSKIIGKSKRNFIAIELLMKLTGYKNRVRVRMNRLNPATVGAYEFRPPFDPDLNWDCRETYDLFKDVVGAFLNAVEFKVLEDLESTWFVFKTTDDTPVISGEIARALSVVFNAIGKARGRHIFVTDSIEEAKARLNETTAKSH